MITKEMIRTQYEKGIVSLIVDPNMESGTVCKIGENWFYFGGLTAEEMSPEEYASNVPQSDIIDEIFDALHAFKDDGFGDEYSYYESVLLENLVGKYHHPTIFEEEMFG